MSEETFEEWEEKTWQESNKERYPTSQQAWNHQQAKLEAKDLRIKELAAENAKLDDTFFGNIANRLAVKNERLLIDCNNLMSENFKLKAREEKLIEAINASISRNVTDLRNVLKEFENE